MPRPAGGEAAIRGRLSSSPGLTTSEAHTLAGLLDAESHLAIVPNNGGTGWRCECSVNLRDDDQDILIAYRDKSGIGHLTPVAARATSRPQVHWHIGSKLECQVLTELLDAHSLRGRKRREYEIWRDAVDICASGRYGVGPRGRVRLARLAEYLLAERVYKEPSPDVALPDMTGQYAASYFAGFFSGEGSFALQPRNARFLIKLRRDDRPLLDAFCRDFAIGSVVNVAAMEPWSPAATWHVTGARDVLKGIALFESAPLLGRKARQYAAWRPGAKAIATAIVNKSALDDAVVTQARAALAHATAYRPPSRRLAADSGLSAAHAAYLEVLRSWANRVDGPLSVLGYAAARRDRNPEWPTRNTIAEAFGGWYEALSCAGLASRAAGVKRASRARIRLDRLHRDAAYRAAVVRRLRGRLLST